MGSAANFYTIISDLHDEFEGRVLNRSLYMFEDILKNEKRLLLDRIHLIIERESGIQSGTFPSQLNESLLDYQYDSCSSTFSTKVKEINGIESYVNRNLTLKDAQDFTEDTSLDYSNDGKTPQGTLPLLGDIRPQIDLPSQVVFDKIFDENQIITEGAASSALKKKLKLKERRKKAKKRKLDTSESPEIPPKVKIGPQRNVLKLKCPYPACAEQTVLYSKFKVQIKHTQKSHTGEELPCEKCNKGLHGDTLYATHAKLHNQKNPAECLVCNKYEENPLDLENHFKTCTPDPDPNGSVECQKCHQKYKNKITLFRHKKFCYPPTYIFKCKYCPKKYESEESCAKHETGSCSLRDDSINDD